MTWLHIALAVRGQLPETLEAAGKLTAIAEAHGDRSALLNSMRAAGMSSLVMGRLVEARDWLERVVREFEASSEVEKAGARAAGQDAGAAGLAVPSWSLWVLGRPDQAIARASDALHRADVLKDPHTQAYVCHYASVLCALRGETAAAYQHADRCFTLSERYGFRQWRNPSRIMRAICAVMLDPAKTIDAVNIDLDDYRAGYHLGITVVLALLCEALLLPGQLDLVVEIVEQALAKCQLNTERIFEAEMYRLKARVLLLDAVRHADIEAQTLLDKALTVAHSQNARSLELRAARDLAELWKHQGKRNEARDLLAPVYGWFTEGFDTRDLKDAKALLEQLAS
jgi:predicted ATPase